jgi:hypothetical protein
MSPITGIWQGGHVVLDHVADWPDGCRVLVEPLSTEEAVGLSEDQWGDSPDAVAEWVQWYESLEPLEITAEEKADAVDWGRRLQAYEEARGNARLKGLFE